MMDWRHLVACFIFLLSFNSNTEAGVEGSEEEPDFTGPIKNATVALGREAVLSCSVTGLGAYKVGWLKAEDQTVLTLHNKVVTHNARISVSHDSERVWRLHIRQLRETDRGCYMCQINTSVMKKQIGCIDVHVPPDIIDSDTSSDVTVEEGGEATITCRARGRPDPRILWRREDSSGISLKGKESPKVETQNGDRLVLTKVDRSQMGAYLCIASNDVPPAVSKRISLNVNFAPTIKVTNQLLGSPPGKDVTMGCYVEAYPNTINYWLKNRGQMLLNNGKHVVEEIRNVYKVHLKLTIKNFNSTDTGTYTCVSTNSLGKAEGSVRLYEIKIPTTTTTTTTTTTEMPTTTDETTTTEASTAATTRVTLPTRYQDELNEVDTSSVKSGRNSRRRQHFATSSSSHHYTNFSLFLFTLLFALTR